MVPELDLLRRHLRRDRGRRRGLLRQDRRRAQHRRGGDAGRHSPVAGALQPADEPHRLARAPARGARPDGAPRRDHRRGGERRAPRGDRVSANRFEIEAAHFRARADRPGDRAALRRARTLRGRPRGRHHPRSAAAARGGADPRGEDLRVRGDFGRSQRGAVRARCEDRPDPRLRRQPRLLPRRHRGPQRQRGLAEFAGLDAEAADLHDGVHAGLEHGRGHSRHPGEGDRPGDRPVLPATQPERELPGLDQRARRARQLAEHPRVQDDPLRGRREHVDGDASDGADDARLAARLRSRAHPSAARTSRCWT